MTLSHARRNNDRWPRAKASTIASINEALIHNRQMDVRQDDTALSNMTVAEIRLSFLKTKLESHAAGIRTTRAGDVYRAAVDLAAAAIRLIEEGSAEYPYASDKLTAAPDLFTEDK